MSMKTTLGLATIAVAGTLATGLTSTATTRASSTPSTARAVDGPEAEAVIGGVGTRVVWPASANWQQSYDNLRFEIAVTNTFGTPTATLLAGADGTKVGYATVATNGTDSNGNKTGTWHSRMDWPFPGNKQLQLKYVHNNQTFDTVVQPTLDGQGLLPTVKVHTVKFWNAVSPTMSTSVDPTISKGIIDNLNAGIPTRLTNVDGIYAENCGTGTKTQWRFAGVGTLDISDACMDMQTSGRSNTSCISEFFDDYDDDSANVHVVFIKRNQQSGWSGAHLRNGDGSYSITIRDDWETNGDLDALFAHEVGHTYVGGHTDGTPGIDCTLPRAQRNLMCPNVGRVMNATQCTAAVNSNRYTDRN